MPSERSEIVVAGQGKIVVVTSGNVIEIGIESNASPCVAPVFLLNQDQAKRLRSVLTEAIVSVIQNQTNPCDPIKDDALGLGE